jgi:hypothetical protein
MRRDLNVNGGEKRRRPISKQRKTQPDSTVDWGQPRRKTFKQEYRKRKLSRQTVDAATLRHNATRKEHAIAGNSGSTGNGLVSWKSKISCTSAPIITAMSASATSEKTRLPDMAPFYHRDPSEAP